MRTGHPIEYEQPIEMIHFVLYRSGLKSFSFYMAFFTIKTDTGHRYICISFHITGKVRYTHTALPSNLTVTATGYDRIEENYETI